MLYSTMSANNSKSFDGVEYLQKQLLEEKGLPITINDYIEAYYGKFIRPYSGDCKLLDEIVNHAIRLNPLFPYSGRINEYGNHMENVLAQATTEVLGSSVRNLGTGYPDLHFEYNHEHYYFEVKIGADVFSKPDTFRMFYTTTPKPKTVQRKNIQNGYHILVHFEHAGAGSLSGRYRVSDLDGFQYWAYGQIQQGSTKDLYENHNIILTESDKLLITH